MGLEVGLEGAAARSRCFNKSIAFSFLDVGGIDEVV